MWFQHFCVKRKKEVITLCKKRKQRENEIGRSAEIKGQSDQSKIFILYKCSTMSWISCLSSSKKNHWVISQRSVILHWLLSHLVPQSRLGATVWDSSRGRKHLEIVIIWDLWTLAAAVDRSSSSTSSTALSLGACPLEDCPQMVDPHFWHTGKFDLHSWRLNREVLWFTRGLL